MKYPKQGWYSEEHARLSGTVIWEAEDGRDVEVTGVCPEEQYMWPDKKFVANVARWKRYGLRLSDTWELA